MTIIIAYAALQAASMFFIALAGAMVGKGGDPFITPALGVAMAIAACFLAFGGAS